MSLLDDPKIQEAMKKLNESLGERQPTPTAAQPSHGSDLTIRGNLNLPMTDTEVLNTFKSAQEHGESFMFHLACAGIAADPVNRALILRTWPKIYQAYGPGSALYEEGL